MALGERADFSMHSGDDVDLVITVEDENGNGVLLSGIVSGIRWQLGRLKTGVSTPAPAQPGQPLISKALDAASGITLSGLSGYVVALSGADTDTIRGGEFYHESEILLSGKRTTVLYGVATVQADLIE